MNATHADRTRSGSPTGAGVPAYGPVDAALGLGLFVVVVDRVTPTVVDVFTEAVPGLSASLVGVALAAFLWFVVVVTALDQVRRQLVALGVVAGDADDREWSRWLDRLGLGDLTGTGGPPSGTLALGYLAVLLGSAGVAAVTFGWALDAIPRLIRAVATLDVGLVSTGDAVVLVAFVVGFELATFALDRLVIGGVRALFAGGARPGPGTTR